MKQLQPQQQPTPKFKLTLQTTIAQLNRVSIKQSKHKYDIDLPFRIRLPEYFNIPAFVDQGLLFEDQRGNKVSIVNKEDAVFRKRMKDLAVLAEGMKRAKNIKEQSRYYFTQGVLLHNASQYLKSIEYFEKFLKIVIYLQDLKSIQLAFNVLGCTYMCMGDYKKSIQFHHKQSQVSQRSDKFIGLMNIGLCHQLQDNSRQAYSIYQQAQLLLTEPNNEEEQERLEALSKIIERVEMRIRDSQVFMTENYGSKTSDKLVQNSLLKEESSLILKKTTNKKQYQQNKLKYAIHAAEENIDEHLKSKMIHLESSK